MSDEIWDFRNRIEEDLCVTNHQKTIKFEEGMWGKIHRQLLNSWLKRIQISGISTIVWFMGSV